MRCFVRYFGLLSVVLFCFALEGVGQEWQYECGNTVFDCLGPIDFSTWKRAVGAYDYHIGDRGWECPYNKNHVERKTDWQNLGTEVVKYARGLTKVSEGGFTGYESKISDLSTTNGGVHVIGNGGAMIFTDDGGIAKKYSEGKNYRFRVKSDGGWPLRVRAYEFAARPWDTLCFFEVDRNGRLDLIKMYGHQSACPGGRKDKCPVTYPQVFKSKCGGQPWSRSFKHNPEPKNIEYTDPKTGIKKIEQGDIIFTIPSGEAEISWGVGHRVMGGGSDVRAGWVFVIDILSAKITDINFREVDECRPDEMVVDYDLAVGASNKIAAEVKFSITNSLGESVFDTTVVNVPAGSNQVRFMSTKFGSSGDYTVSITELNDGWSTVNVSSSISGPVVVRVKPKPTVIIKDTTMCSGEMGAVVLKADGLDASYKFEVQAMDKSNNWVDIGTSTQIGRYELGVLEWDSNPNLQVVTNLYNTSYKYQVKVTNYDSYGIEQCNSGWYEYNVNVIKQPETGPQYHIPN